MKGYQLILMMWVLAGLVHADDWKFAKEVDDVKVYTKTVAGSKYRAVKSITVIPAPIEKVLAHHNNYDIGCSEWVFNCEKQNIIKIDGNRHWMQYFIKTPWPLEPRDYVAEFQDFKQPNGAEVQKFFAVPNLIPPVKGYVRVPSSNGLWITTPKGSNQTEIIYEIHAEPGGEVPDWLANLDSIIIDGPLQTLKDFRESILDAK